MFAKIRSFRETLSNLAEFNLDFDCGIEDFWDDPNDLQDDGFEPIQPIAGDPLKVAEWMMIAWSCDLYNHVTLANYALIQAQIEAGYITLH